MSRDTGVHRKGRRDRRGRELPTQFLGSPTDLPRNGKRTPPSHRMSRRYRASVMIMFGQLRDGPPPRQGYFSSFSSRYYTTLRSCDRSCATQTTINLAPPLAAHAGRAPENIIRVNSPFDPEQAVIIVAPESALPVWFVLACLVDVCAHGRRDFAQRRRRNIRLRNGRVARRGVEGRKADAGC